MNNRFRCAISATLAALLIICTINYTFNIGVQSKIDSEPVREASQSQVIVQDFIHDNYVISEKNPWTDYGLHPIEYKKEIAGSDKSKISAKAAVLIDVNKKEILYEKNSEDKMYPASTTKLMTALTVLQIMNPTDVVTIGGEVEMIAADSSVAGFRRGQIVTVEELLEGLLISSGNDAAYILGKAAGLEILNNNIANEGKTFTNEQCVQRFVYEMNKNVRDMELKNTNFTSPDGYDDNQQYTTAEDLSKIAIEAYENDTIRKICGMDKKYSETLGKTWESTNQLINKESQFYYQYCMGLKTGSTGLAGKCFVSVGKKGDDTCVSVILDAQTEEQRWNDTRFLLKMGLE